MKKSLFSSLLLSLALCFTFPCFSQKPPIKFGKIDMEDLKMPHYPLDSSAHAAILCDYGYAELEYDSQLGEFFIKFERHVRYKIIDQAGYDYANFSIPLYQPSKASTQNEQIIKFKGGVYNLENGKISEIKVSKKDLLEEATTENYTLEKIAMPGIQEGCIIEMEYTIKSPFTWNLQDWQFQYTIPVKHSEFIVKYPEWFIYKMQFTGYDFNYLTVKDQSSEPGTIRINKTTSRQGEHMAIGQGSKNVSEVIPYQKETRRWVAENMPAFEIEPHISSYQNYLTAVEFELAATKFPSAAYEDYGQSWEVINKSFWDADNLGGQLKGLKVNWLKDEVTPIIVGQESTEEKVAAIYYHLKKNVLWNEWYGKYATQDLKKVWKDQKGSAAELNLLLTAMLQAAGLDANPVVLSTRNHGYLKDWFPNRNQFNYLISAVKMEDGKYWLLDATDRSLPINLLPPRCINEKGMMVTEDSPIWLDLNPEGKYRHLRQVKATLNDDLSWTGSMDVKGEDYAAQQMRQQFTNQSGEKEYVQMIENENEGINLANPVFEGMKSIANEAKASYEITIEDQVMDGGELLYFNPMLTFSIDKNPFKLQERKYPVDYNYPYEYVYAASFEIPENYSIEELPETLSVVLPENGGRYLYNVTATGNTINLTSMLKIDKYLFLPEEYPSLKEFYNLIVDKMAGQIVLKKKT